MDQAQTPMAEFLQASMSKLKEMVDVNTIVGTPIQAEGVTIIPVSKVSCGFASGGSDFATKKQKPEADNSFGGGGGAGINIVPVAFLIVKEDNVRLLPIAPPPGTAVDRVIELVPEVMDKVTGFIEKQQDRAEARDKESF